MPELGRLPGSQQAPCEPAGPLAGHRPSRARSARPAALAGAGLFYPPPFRKRNSEPLPPRPLPRSTRKRRVFLSDTPHPLRSAEASRRLSKLCAPPGARGQLGRRPRPGCCASGAGAAGRAWGGSSPRQPPGSAGHPRLCPPPRGPACGGGGARGGGGRGAPGGACPPPSCPFGGSLRGWSSGLVRRFRPDFPGLTSGRGQSSVRPSSLGIGSEAYKRSGGWDLRRISRARLSKSPLPKILTQGLGISLQVHRCLSQYS